MISKIIKHDVIALRKPLLVNMAIVFVITLVSSLGIHFFHGGLTVTSLIIGILGIVVFSAVFSILLMVHYYRSLYGKTGYFTWSIPASSREIFWGKTLFNSGVLAIVSVFIYLCGAIIMFSMKGARSETFSQFFEDVKDIDYLNLILWGFLVFTIVSSIASVQYFQFAITCGNRTPFLDRLGKVGGPVVVGVVLYVVVQVISLISLVIPGGVETRFGDKLFVRFVWENIVTFSEKSASDFMPVWGVVLCLLLSVFLGWFTYRFYRHGTSLR